MKHNKFVKIGKSVKINLYLPGFPSKAFYNACQKVTIFKEKMPCISTLISITSACKYNCEHCYQKHDIGKDVDIEILINTVRKLQNIGIAFFNIEGGEPFLVFDKLKQICETIDNRSEILINSTGDGMTYDNLTKLKENNNIIGIMFSLHTYEPEKLNSFMKSKDAWIKLENGIHLCHKVGIPVTFNTCLKKNDYYDGTYEKIMDTAKNFDAALIQLIKPKPSGGWLESGADNFSDDDFNYIKRKVHKYNNNTEFKNYPTIFFMMLEEHCSLFGCTAGGTDRFYINAKGDLQACEFLNLSFGNIQTDNFDSIYNNMRKQFDIPGTCMLCEKYSKEILKLYKDNNLVSLPLSPELSKKIYENWDRGKPTEFYQKLRNI